ncbi:bile acid:sodium symporter [Asticcacaulis sp. BYS171W]|uniref:Bile acid:sodium symporter n=1 Tax=Asticcacaulis aquaticus TaxID=2984212 RepID=A0ABT5HXM5_9CAUL|nr:bile acid:sodium symporter family protein [Asticcacaulis aquaticus]MDC7684784.1 bile acid:sodium symporter [Asticcacaulis aquaticus]
MKLFKILDPYILMLLGMVVLASVLPVRGSAAVVAEWIKDAAIVLLFFLHGAKLSRESIWAGMKAWKVHALVFATTFAVFPLLGLGLRAALSPLMDPMMLAGLLFLCLLPSTVQSSIAFTAIAKGNVAAAVCSASVSNILGILITPMLVALLMGQAAGGVSFDAVTSIALQLLLPFIVGHLLRPVLKGVLDTHKTLVGRVDRGSILLVVYTAFSASVVEGLWSKVGLADLALMFVAGAVLLAAVMGFTWWASGRAGLSREDRVVVLFCGSKKSLASGVPMAGTLFPPAVLGPVLLPVMLFHQLQLIVCAFLAPRLTGDRIENP